MDELTISPPIIVAADPDYDAPVAAEGLGRTPRVLRVTIRRETRLLGEGFATHAGPVKFKNKDANG